MFELDPVLSADTHIIGQFELCMVLLHKDANYPWCILVPKRRGLREIHHLGELDQQQLMRESSHLSEVMTSLFAPNKMNIAAIGNIVSQLHLHHVARFKDDPTWPKPIWGALPPTDYSAAALQKRIERLRSSLEGEGFSAVVDGGDDRADNNFTP
ncbi:HIT domain-containing protein [Teredinibacter waterburyi]|jgi:Diadenosine tetraphosphate (Ap4A) hydrolase and other HIT family hydrolases|uniref:HIT domain-containing protein n=1 Tax=Teredinibacter waterburyi TaxID=1500538 RepID=UPI00165F2032|nr:HIT domain-containing protein [Teredinibacter waterburyi]